LPVPTTLADLSLVAASNFPQGTDTPSSLDDTARAHATFLAQIRDGSHVVTATEKTTLVDADLVPINDSAAASIIKKITWANVKAALKTYFDSVTTTLTNKTLTTPVLTNPSYSGATANAGSITTIDINGGTIDGTVIGGADPRAVSATTVNASGQVSGGSLVTSTALRVTGGLSALTASSIFIDSPGGIGRVLATGANTSTYGQVTTTVTSSDGSLYRDVLVTTSTGLAVTGAFSAIKSQNATSIFTVNNADVTDTNSRARFDVTAGNQSLQLLAIHADNVFINRASGSLQLQVAFTTQATLSADGNLGIGVTPSAWAATYKALQFGGSSALWGATTAANAETYLTANMFWDGGTRNYLATGSATEYAQVGGVHRWKIAPSGTAGAAITFTDAMTLDASGYLLVGTTTSLGAGVARAQIGSAGTTTTSLLVKSANSSVSLYASSTSESYLAYASGTPMIFGEGPDNLSTFTERMRLTAAGDLLVGHTGAGIPLLGASIIKQYSDAFSTAIVIGHATGAASASIYARFGYNGSEIGSITQSGTTAVLYNTTSDQRLKENIVDADSASALIDSLQVRQFDWIADASHQRYGFVAQELALVAPEAVHQPVDPDNMMAVDYSKLVPMLVKEIQSLRTRVAALEAA
jgi:hypothetical protein